MEEEMENYKNIRKSLQALNPDLLREDVVRDNKIEFPIEGETYRVRIPTNRERNDGDKFKQKMFDTLIKTEGYKLRIKLEKELKEFQGIDINEFDETIEVICEQIKDLYDRLSETTSANKKGISSIEKQLEDRFKKVQKLSMAKAEALAFCVEEELYTRYLEYLIVKCTEKLVDPDETGKESTWERVWNSQEEFDNDNNMILTERATLYLSKLFATIRRF